MSEDVHKLKQEKQALEVDLQLIKKEGDLAEARATSTSGKIKNSPETTIFIFFIPFSLHIQTQFQNAIIG